VSKVLMILKIVRELPDKLLSTFSRAKITKEEAPCSNDIQKNTTKNANIITAIKRSLTTFVYLANLEITTNKNNTNAIRIATFCPAIDPIWKFSSKSTPAIFESGSLNANPNPKTVITKIRIESNLVNGLGLSSGKSVLTAAAFSAASSLLGGSPTLPKMGFANQNCSVPKNMKIPASPNPQCQP